jgi:predicted nucleic acid-binding protein
MARSKILDTNVLINHWHRFPRGKSKSPQGVREHAEFLIEAQRTNVIVSPVAVEFLAGARSTEELRLYAAYLEAFEVLDQGNIPAVDWAEARKFAQGIRTGRARKLGDCLIQAIAKRLNCDIVTGDPDFKSRMLPKRE